MSVYGGVVTADDVRLALESFLKAWMPAYLGEIAAQRQLPRTALPAIRSWASSTRTLDLNVEDQLPACVIICPGITGNIEMRGNGDVSAEFAVGIGFVLSGRTQGETNRNVSYYVAAARTAVLQHKSIGGFAADTRWVDETLDELPFNDSRTLAGGVVNLGVRVDAVLNSRLGLSEPPSDPTADPGSYGEVASADVAIERLA